MECYLSPEKIWKETDFNHPNVHFISNNNNNNKDKTLLTYDWDSNHKTIDLTLEIAQDKDDMRWKELRENGTMYLHVFVNHQGYSANPHHPTASYSASKTIYQSAPVVKYDARRNLKNATYLIERMNNKIEEQDLEHKEYKDQDPALTHDIVSYWKPEMAIRIVTDWTRFPLQQVPPLVYKHAQIRKLGASSYKVRGVEFYTTTTIIINASLLQYLPVMYVDEMGLTSDKYVPLNRSITHLPLKISFEPISLAKWQFMLILEDAFTQQRALGIGEEDLDDIRNMITDTNPYLLATTSIVSVLHMLFDILAFKSDIEFWRKNKSIVGISIRSMCISLLCNIIIVLYLCEERTTLLVLIPNGVSMVLQVWKIVKATGATVDWTVFYKPKLLFPRLKDQVQQSVGVQYRVYCTGIIATTSMNML